MKLIKYKLALLVLVAGLVVGCSSSSDPNPQECTVEVQFDGQTIRYCPDNPNDTTVILDRVQDEFVWQAMNLNYFWQEDVPNLSDGKFANYDELHAFLNGYPSSEELFDDLLSNEDRFSKIVDDYIALEQSFQGISKSFGYDFRLLKVSEGSNDLFGFVKYVVPGGPADLAGLTRGVLFNKVNGVDITVDNYREALFESNSYDLTLAELKNEQVVSTSESLSLVSIELAENPIHLSKVIDAGGVKVGYLVYNQFVNNNQSHRELNNVFGDFENQGISELVVDLRYNPGGSIASTLILSSMIYDDAVSSTNFGSLLYNSKLLNYFNGAFNFYESLPIFNDELQITGEESLNRLSNLSRVFILTSGSTASASEFLIVGLSPYMEVITIGTQTVGKNEASVTLYDSKNTLFRKLEGAEINPNHTYAIQPIISELANSEGFSDYASGLEPDVIIDEKNFINDLKPLGDLQEPLLEEALSIISGAARKSRKTTKEFDQFDYFDPKQSLQKAIVDFTEK